MSRPVVLSACVHNGGRSLAATLLAEHHGGGGVEVRSAGSEPGSGLDPVVVQVLHEGGLRTDGEAPQLLTSEGVGQADVVVTMGCGETCPVFPGTTYEDWPLDDPKGRDVDTVRRIVDEVERRVVDLLGRLPERRLPGRRLPEQ